MIVTLHLLLHEGTQGLWEHALPKIIMDLSDNAECPLTVSIAVGEAQQCCEDLQELREARHSKSCFESYDLAPVHINSFGLLCFWVNPGDCICWKELKVFPFLLDIFGLKYRTESSSQVNN
ncbi:hypothetical protein PoB_003251300 [Plakobranchus ocellatus]|uniref:Uncharacterized protein n=1 Tax=Plakobranchus ocellatus TaxID=259542 RepID=A0AAV4AFG0_9GAST|nr:hypothetical protein PoB_003251300 [Plakobranchus ocellatus]